MRVLVTGAFLTGEALQVRVSEYSRFQRALAEILAREGGGGWLPEAVAWRNVDSYEVGGGYRNRVPLVLARREGSELRSLIELEEGRRPEEERRWFRGMLEGWQWALRSAHVDVYDFGVAVLVGEYDVEVPSSLSPEQARRTISSITRLRVNGGNGVQSPLAAAYQALARDTARQFSATVERCAPDSRQEPWMKPFLAALSRPEDGPVSAVNRLEEIEREEWGRLLWLHPIYMLYGDGGCGYKELSRRAEPFRATFSAEIELPLGAFMPGIDESAVAVREEDADLCRMPIELTELHWAYCALFMEIDRGLLAVLDSDRWQALDSLSMSEDEADRVFHLYMRVQEVRARLDSALTDLGGGELSVWTAIADVQKFDELVAAVEGKVTTLERITERRVQEASAARAARTSNILSGLTALTVVTVAAALLGNVLGTHTDVIGHVEVRVIAIVAAFAIAIVLYREAQNEIALKRRFGRRFGGR